MCCIIAAIAGYVKQNLVLQAGIDPTSRHYQWRVLPLYYKSDMGLCGRIWTYDFSHTDKIGAPVRNRTLIASSANLRIIHYTTGTIIWRKTEESNPIPVKRTWFSRPVAGPSPLHHLPLFIIWNDGWDLNPRVYSFADCCIGPLCHRHTNLVGPAGIEPTTSRSKRKMISVSPRTDRTVANACIKALYMDEPTCLTAWECFNTN